jgi:predicted nucleotidyltransferase
MDPRRLNDIARAHGVELVVQFGSTVSGTSHAESDLDLAVLVTRAPLSYAAHAELAAALQSLVPGREVDLVVLNHADPLLLHQVTEHGRLLYGQAVRWAELRAYAFRRYQDHRRFLEMERDYVERAIAAARL